MSALPPGSDEAHGFVVAGNRRGRQFVREATDLLGLADGSYDLVVSSHVIEHCANPLRALREWRRVLTRGGRLLLVAPHQQFGFDHRRSVTSIAHLEEDEARNAPESDLTHLPEVLRSHDLSMDPRGGPRGRWEAENRSNLVTRVIHHHVFTSESLLLAVARAGFRPLEIETHPSLGIVLLAERLEGAVSDLSAAVVAEWLVSDANWRTRSFAPADRRPASPVRS